MALVHALDSATVVSRLEAGAGPTVLGFFGDFSEAARRARPEFERFCAEHPEHPAILVDVGKIKDVHTRFGVTAVPTVLLIERGKVIRRAAGAQSSDAYARALLGVPGARTPQAKGERKSGHRVTVFTTPTCSWCNRTKSYLRQNAVPFQEVDVSRDERAMQRMVGRSGQMGVPQLDIDGRMVVGFDKARIDQLLGLGTRAATAPTAS